jgi:O-antigen/teichoic acid export membrane protein
LQWTSGDFFLLAAGKILGPVAVGAISAAQNIVGVIHVLFLATENVVPGQAARAYAAKGIEGLLRYLRRFAWWGGLMTVTIALIAGIFADFWLALLYGDAYAGYAYVVRWFSVIYVFGFFVSPVASGLRALERTRVFFTSRFWMSLFSVVAAYPLILHFGVSGVMIGLLMVKIGVLALVAVDFKERIRTC